MSKKDFNVSVLSDFIHEILSFTEGVKRVLEFECMEARYVLQPCTIETMIEKEIGEECCTCDSKSSLEDHAEEIVEGIGRALAQAQELREKIVTNISKQKRKAREPDLETIYMPVKKITSKKSGNAGKQKSTKSPDLKNKPTVETSRIKTSGCKVMASKEVESKIQVTMEKKFECKTVTQKKLLQLSAGNTMALAKGRPTKNFVTANKCNIKKLQRNSKSMVDLNSANFTKRSRDLSPLSGTSETLSSCTTSIAQLNDLMTKVSVEATKEASAQENKNANCPCHGVGVKKIFQKRVRSTIDLMEALDRFGIPGPIVRILKSYHSYTNKVHSTNEITDKRCQRATDKFLAEFNNLNDYRTTQRETTFSELADLTINFESLFRRLYEPRCDVTDRTFDEITAQYTDLNIRGKSYPLEKFELSEYRKSKKTVIPVGGNRNGWSANGIWYRSNPDSFPSTTGIHCIRYANKRQLLTFFELNQRLQLMLYHEKLIDLLTTVIMPNVLESFDNSSAEYSEAYKMIFTIAQALNPRVPTLVRTDV